MKPSFSVFIGGGEGCDQFGGVRTGRRNDRLHPTVVW